MLDPNQISQGVLTMVDHGPGMVGIPCQDWLYTEAVLSLINLQVTPGSIKRFQPGGTFPDKKRNDLIEYFLTASHLQWLYFSDSDQVVSAETVIQLLKTGLDVVGGLVVSRKHPEQLECGPIPSDSPILKYLADSRPVDATTLPLRRPSRADLLKAWEAIEARSLLRVGWTGGGSLLVRRKVLESIPSPWFCALPGWENEDIYFCAKAAQHGFPVYVDTRVQVGHLGLTNSRPTDVKVRVQPAGPADPPAVGEALVGPAL